MFLGGQTVKKIPKIFRAYGAPPPWEMCTYTTDLRYIAMKKPVAYIGLMKGGGACRWHENFCRHFLQLTIEFRPLWTKMYKKLLKKIPNSGNLKKNPSFGTQRGEPSPLRPPPPPLMFASRRRCIQIFICVRSSALHPQHI